MATVSRIDLQRFVERGYRPVPSVLRIALGDAMTVHEPVLADEVLDLLRPQPGQTVVDCTFGAGGHAQRIAEELGSDGLYVAIDQDPDVRPFFDAFASRTSCETRFERANFAVALDELVQDGVHANAILMDLGISSMQVDRPERGFSYARQAPLDMRMDPSQPISAATLVAEAPEADLARWFREYGEERYARQIARAIVRRRATAPITTTADLVEVVRSAVPAGALFAGGHPAKRVFQALRIVVNAELDLLPHALESAFDLLAVTGVLAVISFHSLEDRIVKRFMRARAQGCICPPDMPVCGCGRTPDGALLNSRAIMPSAAESHRNPRSRSARLRAVRKLESE
jgi:16S rRNA (cytosine1402-N4)-methyltransferase